MNRKVVTGQVTGAPAKEPDALDGMINRLVQRQEERYRWRAKAWAFIGIVLMVLWALQRLQWEWIVATATGLFSLVNFLGLLSAGAEFSRAEIRKRLIAEGRYRQARGQ